MVAQFPPSIRRTKQANPRASDLASVLPEQRAPQFAGKGVLAILPVLVFFYVLVVLPLIGGVGTTRFENILFWPTLAGLTLVLALFNRSHLDTRFITSLPIASLAAYMIFAGASISWAHSPNDAFSRYILQLLTIVIILTPFAFPIDTSRLVQRLHLCALIAVAISALYVLTTPASPIGHRGYFIHKQELGLLAGIAIILAVHELLFGGWRRWLGALSMALTFWVIVESQSKGSLALLFVALAFSVVLMIAGRQFRISPAFVVGGFVIGSEILSRFWTDPMGRIAWYLYGDSTITGRTFIWEFMNYQISHYVWFGWGFHSYWNVPNSPHQHAWGFVKDMISCHSGYLELKLDTGRIGYWIFLVFIYAALHILERVRRIDPLRAWLYMAISMYVVLMNLMESIWLQTFPIWMLYLVMVGASVHGALAGDPASATSGSAAPPDRRAGLFPKRKLDKIPKPAARPGALTIVRR
jgi:exopolysaccharide production protein ExoQ